MDDELNDLAIRGPSRLSTAYALVEFTFALSRYFETGT